jgi:AraC-like DNA-binding protein
MKKPHYTKVTRAFKKNKSINKVAIQLGVSTTYLYKHFPKLCEKYKCKRTPIHLSKEVLLTELKSVISVKQVAKVIGISPQALYGRHSDILKEFTRKMKRPISYNLAVRALRATDGNIALTAYLLSVSECTFRRKFKQLCKDGVDVRSHKEVAKAETEKRIEKKRKSKESKQNKKNLLAENKIGIKKYEQTKFAINNEKHKQETKHLAPQFNNYDLDYDENKAKHNLFKLYNSLGKTDNNNIEDRMKNTKTKKDKNTNKDILNANEKLENAVKNKFNLNLD